MRHYECVFASNTAPKRFVTGDNLGHAAGAVAQLVERLDGIQEVARSTRVGSTEFLGFMLAGFVAGEGCFSISTTKRSHADGEPIRKFVFSVNVEARDLRMLETLRDFLGAGSITYRPPEKVGWQPMVTFAIKSLKAHWQVVIPFADRYLLPCAKQDQFLRWRGALEQYVERYNVRCGRGPSTCSVDGCDQIVRGRGLCRSHYYRATGW